MNQKPKHPTIALHKVESSQIAGIGHDPATNTMAVQFKSKSGPGSIYHYAGVSHEQFAAFKSAEPSAAAWRDHTATYQPIQTVEWKRWNANSGSEKAMGQEDFASFLEENMSDIATVEGMPTGTDMLRMATEFEATADKRFKSKVNLQGGGVNLVFVDQDNAATEQAMRMFERFSLGLRVFLNGDAYRIDARLKYRQAGGVLMFWYELIRADRVFEDAIKAEFTKVKDQTGFPLLYGNPGTK